MNDELIDDVRRLCAGESLPPGAVPAPVLDELGLVIENGRLADPPELLEAGAIRAALNLAAPHLARCDTLFSVGSTNTWQLGRVAEPDFHGSVCLAERQVAGRGRRGRHWVSPFGRNIYMSVGWKVPRNVSVAGLSIVAGMAIAGALRDLGVAAVGLKWPNDLLLGGRKLGGILVELAAPTAHHHLVVIGCGINIHLNEAHGAQVEQAFTTLPDDIGQSRNAIVGALLESLLPALDHFGREGFAPFAAAWADYDCFAGESLVVHLAERRVEGRNLGIDESGNLLLETADGAEAFNAGEVSVRRVAS